VLRVERNTSCGAGDGQRFELGGLRCGLSPDLAATQKSWSLALRYRIGRTGRPARGPPVTSKFEGTERYVATEDLM